MKQLILVVMSLLFFGCSNEPKAKLSENESAKISVTQYEGTGIGKFTKYGLSPTVDEKLAEAGNVIYTTKCITCHKLTDEKLIGPGWKDVTKRFKPEWVLNFITNTDEMLNKDEKAIELLKEANGVRMLVAPPITEQEAKEVYEFMRKNDGIK